MRHTASLATATFLATLLCSAHAFAADVYVSTSGSDSNPGTANQPFATLDKALAAAKGLPSGSVVHVGAGQFVTTHLLDVPVGISLVGAGRTQTIVRGQYVGGWYEGGILRLKTSGPAVDGNQRVASLTVQGTSTAPKDPGVVAAPWSCISVENRSKVVIDDVLVESCERAGIELKSVANARPTDVEVKNFVARETSIESTAFAWGQVTIFGSFDRLSVHDGVIEHYQKTGYGLKVTKSYTNGDDLEFLRDAKFYNLEIRGKDEAPWANYNSPNISMEVWNVGMEGVEIFANEFDHTLSLERGGYIANAKYSARVHNNLFTTGTGAALELAISKARVDHNVFDYAKNKNKWNVIGEYNGGGSNVAVDVSIDHNLFKDVGGWLLVFTSAIDAYRFDDNVVDGDIDALVQFRKPNTPQQPGSLEVVNDVFRGTINHVVVLDGVPAGPSSLTCDHDMFGKGGVPDCTSPSNWKFATPGFAGGTLLPSSYFPASATSNLVNAGRDVGLPAIGVPDVGLAEWGDGAWTVGLSGAGPADGDAGTGSPDGGASEGGVVTPGSDGGTVTPDGSADSPVGTTDPGCACTSAGGAGSGTRATVPFLVLLVAAILRRRTILGQK
jgi:MYXO-CTERM domain-containing protein